MSRMALGRKGKHCTWLGFDVFVSPSMNTCPSIWPPLAANVRVR